MIQKNIFTKITPYKKERMYNPQNEMFQCFKTKCSNPQNETYLCQSFFSPSNSIKKHWKSIFFQCFFIVPTFGYLAKIINFTTNKRNVMPCFNAVLMPLLRHYITRQNLCAAYHASYTA